MTETDLRFRFGATDYALACYLLAGCPKGSGDRAAVLQHAARLAVVQRRGLTESVRDVLDWLACCRIELRVAPRLVGELTTRGDAMTYTHPSGSVATCCLASDGAPEAAEALLDEVHAWGTLDSDQLDALGEEVTKHLRVVLGRV